MSGIALSVILGYLVTTTLVGSLLARRAADSSGWAVADGRMGVLLIAAGVAGTRIGGVGTYGVAGDVLQDGLWNLWYAVNTFLALALVGVVYARAFRRLGLRTVGQAFSERYGSRRCQVITSLCVQTEYLIINILEPFVIGTILSALLGIPFGVAVFIGAAVLVLYTALGGLWGSAFTNLIHCAVVLLGLFAVAVAGLISLGGWSGLAAGIDTALAQAEPPIEPRRWWSLTGAGWGAILAMFFSATIHTPAASVYVNFSSAARRAADLPRAFLLAGVIAAMMPLLAGWIGAQTLAAYGAQSGVSSYQAITRLAVDLDPWLGGLALAAVLAAVISSGGPILLSSATMLVQDWLPRSGQLSSRQLLVSYRLTTVVYGLLAALIAWRGEIGSILDLLLLGFAMVVPPAVALTFLLFWRRTTEAACFWGITTGYLFGLAWWGAAKLCQSWAVAAPERFDVDGWAHRLLIEGGGIDPSYVTTLVPLAVVPLLTLLRPVPADERTEAFFRRLRE